MKTTFTESDALFPSPGMGWQTFHHFADEDPALGGLPSGAAYFRFYWKELEPEEGRIDFAKLDGLLAHARRAGQKLAFRVMCAGTDRDPIYVPQWLRDKGCKGYEYQYEGGATLYWVPDLEAPMFQETHFRLIEELGKRYDGHPDVDHVDIGTVGLWGEWHMSGTPVPLPSLETRRLIIDTWRRAFAKTPKVMLIGDAEGMRYATHNGCGWRADCLGDMGGFSKTWNHMENFYLQQIEKTDAGDAWKHSPIAFESCWDMRKWKAEGWDIRYIFDYALRLHASHLNNKSAPIPEGTRPEIERFLRKLGYRLVLREAEWREAVAPGGVCPILMLWENVGVAPPYHDYRLAFRLAGPDGEATVVETARSIRGWLPGKVHLAQEVTLPRDLKPGRYTLSLGVVAPATKQPAVRLAVTAPADDLWYPLGPLEIRRPRA
ncbi:MAG: DUF4832 domain-containing protein [Armatimonadetes bacterium]|jgi:hypothetical protein|nr:DUF4832 domain-containing protein [Armatimonadota bacterium]